MGKKVCITGAAGFIGRALTALLVSQGYEVVALARKSPPREAGLRVVWREVGDIEAVADFGEVVRDADAVVHLAGRAHVLREHERDPEAAFMAVNAAATARLAKAAGEQGVGRFVFLSSIAVNGYLTPDVPFTEDAEPRPHNAYGRSKLAAEQALAAEHERSGLPVTALRPPLVYGAGAKGNFPRLLSLAASGLPLPLGNARNRRSMISVDNLAGLIAACLDRPHPDWSVYLPSDNEDVTTAELIAKIRRLMGKRKNLLPFPQKLVRAAAAVLGQAKTYDSMCGPLAIDPARAMRELAWTPGQTLDQGLVQAVEWYCAKRR